MYSNKHIHLCLMPSHENYTIHEHSNTQTGTLFHNSYVPQLHDILLNTCIYITMYVCTSAYVCLCVCICIYVCISLQGHDYSYEIINKHCAQVFILYIHNIMAVVNNNMDGHGFSNKHLVSSCQRR